MPAARNLAFADASTIVQSHHKDRLIEDALTSRLEEVTKLFKGQYFANVYSKEISIGAKLIYLALTTLRGKRTLGEEYVDLIYVNRRGNGLIRRHKRLLFLLSYTLLPYALSRLVRLLTRNNKFEEEEEEEGNNATQSGLVRFFNAESFGSILDCLTDLNLIAFYFKGNFYNISKRVFGMRYAVGHKLDESEIRFRESGNKTYRILGTLLLVQLFSKRLLPAFRWMKGLIADDQNEKATSSLSVGETTLSTAGLPTDSQVEHISLEQASEMSFIPSDSRKCILCLGFMLDPSCAPCGHVFCWKCLLSWCNERPECPLCRQTCHAQNVLPIR